MDADDPVHDTARPASGAPFRRRSDGQLLQTREALQARTHELARSLSLMRAMLDATTDGILATTNDGRLTGHNEKFVRMWGLDEATMALGEHRLILKVTSRRFADPKAFVDRIERIYAGEVAEDDVLDVLELADGRVFERCSRVQRIDGQAIGRVWSFRDVTEVRRAEEAMRDEARVLELLHRTGAAIGATLDLAELLQTVTDAATQLSGAKFGAFFYNTVDDNGEAFQLYTLSGAPRAAFERFGHPRSTPLFEPTFSARGIVRIDDVLADARYGQWAPHHGMPAGHLPVRSYLAVPVVSHSGGGNLGGLFFGHPQPGVFDERAERLMVAIAAQAAIAIDNARLYEEARRIARDRERLVEAERAARAEIERVSRMKDEFLAMLSHELRTPLTAVLGWARAMQMKPPDGDTLARGLAAIARNARSQAQLIEDLLDMSRIVSGKVRLDVQRTDLAAVVEAAVDAVRPTCEAKGLTLRTILDPLAGPVAGDPNRLQQVVWNLLSNAAKFTPRGGAIDVLLERVNSHLEVTVRDNGAGIDPAFLPHVFDRFRQADASTTRRHGGLGLGLSIVKQLVELHGGNVRAKSAGPGTGSTFVVALPLAPVREAPHPVHPAADNHTSQGASSAVDLTGVTVLVVDDEPDARELIQQVLEQSHARVLTAGSSSDALETVVSHAPDVIVSDIGMPGTDGYAFMRELRARGPGAGGRTPAIALTAFARSEDRTRAMLVGYQLHIAKPIEPPELLAAVGSLCGRVASD